MTADDRNNGETTGRDGSGRFTAGNPGRPRGARHRSTLAAQALLDGELEALTRRAVDQALTGDVQALRLCLDRALPALKESPVVVDIPRIRSAADALEAVSVVVEAVAAGDLTPGQGQSVMAVLEGARRVIETVDLEQRIAALESRHE
jgi:hypothetical protein